MSKVNVTNKAQRRTTLVDAAFVTFFAFLFFILASYQLDLPGLYTDEAYDVIPAMQMALGHEVELQGNVLQLGSLRLPLMSSSAYQGVTYTYLAVPFFAIGGVNIFSLRLMTVLVGVLGVVLTYFLGKAWFGRWEGLLAAAMIALAPSWIFWSRLGVYVVSVVVPISAGALLAFTLWSRRRPLGVKNGAFYLGCFLLGLGLTTKLLFLWSIAAIGITALILYGRPAWENRREWLQSRGRWLRIFTLGIAAFGLGAFPFVLYNLLTRETFYLLRSALSGAGATKDGVDNTALIRNLWTSADSFKVLLDGGYFWFQGEGGQPRANGLMPSIFIISAVGLVVLALWHRGVWERPTGRAVVGTALLAAGLLVSILMAVGALGSTVMVWSGIPILSSAIAGVLVLVLSGLKRQTQLAAVSSVLLATMLISGAIWWLGGDGRPARAAEGAFLGLWPVDGAGILFWIAGTGLILLLGLDKHPAPRQRATAAALAMIGLLVVQSTVTVSGLWSTHQLVILPMPQIVMAAFAVGITRAVKGWFEGSVRLRKLAPALPAVILLAPAIALEVTISLLYHRDLSRNGGATTFSDAIYGLRQYLEVEHGDKPIVAMDWGFRRPLQLLSGEKVMPIEGYGLSEKPPDEFYFSLREFLKDPRTVYLFHARYATAYPRHDDFFEQARLKGKTPTLLRTFYQRDGTPIYEVYVVQ